MKTLHWASDPTFVEAFTQKYMATLPEDRWGNEYFHLSDAAGCLRRAWYRIAAAKGLIPCPGLESSSCTRQVTLDVGNHIHAELQDTLVNRLEWCQAEDIEVKIRLPELNMKGSADAVCSVERYRESLGAFELGIPELAGSHFPIDFKSKADKVVKERGYPGKEAKEPSHTFPDEIMKYPNTGYYTQLQSYMYFLMQLYPERYPDIRFGIILYLCKNDGRFFAVRVPYDESVAMSVIERAKLVQGAIENGVPPKPEYGPAEIECCGRGAYTPCPYFATCWGK